jgi:arsenate reductase-like glutaredoxin family protein
MTRADKRKFHYVYKITRNDGKYYIGMHSTDDMDDGYFGSGKILWYSIRKHGKEAHIKEILELLPSREALKHREKQLNTDELRADVMCMNIAPGGGGGFIDAAHQQKCAAAGGSKSWMKNVKLMHTAEATQKRVETKRKTGVDIKSAATMRETANSPKAMAKRKLTFAERGHMRGEKNSQFGTCWVTDGVKPVKIKKEQLDEFLLNGYRRGRSSRE